MLAGQGRWPVTWDGLSKALQVAGTVLGIPAAAAGAWSVYRTYFSTEVVCQNLKDAIVATMEKHESPEARRALLQKDVEGFEGTCGRDPRAQEFLKWVKASLEPQAAAPPPAPPHQPPAAPTPAPQPPAEPETPPLRGPLAGIPLWSLPPVGFPKLASGERKGWVSLALVVPRSREDVHFDGFPIAQAGLPPRGTVLIARWALPIWREQPGPPIDPSTAQGRLRPGDCVRVIS